MRKSYDSYNFVTSKKTAGKGIYTRTGRSTGENANVSIDNNLATKQDILELERAIKELEYKVTIRFSILLVVAVTVLAAIIKM